MFFEMAKQHKEIEEKTTERCTSKIDCKTESNTELRTQSQKVDSTNHKL